MRRYLFSLLLSAAIFLPATGAAPVDPKVAAPPLAKKNPKSFSLHSDTWVDPYFWMREKTSPEVKCNMQGGHGGFSGRYDSLKEQAFVQAFLLDQLGIDR